MEIERLNAGSCRPALQSPAVLVKRTGCGNTHRVGLGVPSRQQLTRMGTRAKFGRTVRRTDELKPDGLVPSRVIYV